MKRFMSPGNTEEKEQFDEERIVRMLRHPEGRVDVVLDTDTYNEGDDQFALSYMVRSQEKINVLGIYAAPFFSEVSKRADSPKDGMEKSYLEIMKLLDLLNRKDLNACVKKGSEGYLKNEREPVRSEAAEDIVRLARLHSPENPLYVVGIAVLTNIASALLIAPEIKDRIVVVWLGGHSLEWPDNYEFNLRQDVAAARVVFGCGVPLVHLPCRGVVSSFTITGPELNTWLKGKNELCDHLVELLVDFVKKRNPYPTWSKALWDVTAVAWLLGGFMEDRLEMSPIPEYDYQWGFDKTRHPIRYVYSIDRDKLMLDLIEKITKSC